MRDWLTILCVGVLTFGIIGTVWFYQSPRSVVYACSDKADHPADVAKLCARMTQGQWWSK